MRATFVTLLAATAALTIVSADASAQGRRHVRTTETYDTGSLQSLPLTVNRRSWLDPGPVVPKGSTTSYVAASTEFNKTPDQVFAPDGFGNDVIKGQPYVPGRSVAVVEFSSEPNGSAYVDNVIGPQNFVFNPAPSVP